MNEHASSTNGLQDVGFMVATPEPRHVPTAQEILSQFTRSPTLSISLSVAGAIPTFPLKLDNIVPKEEFQEMAKDSLAKMEKVGSSLIAPRGTFRSY